MAYNYDRSGKKGKQIILIIVLMCGFSFVLWYNFFGRGSGLSDNDPYPADDVVPEGTCYHYQLLTDDGKKIYRSLYKACKNYEAEIPIKPIEINEFDNVIYAFRHDHPEFFWLHGTSVKMTEIDGSVIRVSFDLPSDVSEKMAKLEKKAEEILKNAPQLAYDKVKYFYEYIINKTEYDLTAPDNQNAYSALVNGKSVCGGYANAFLYLCDKASVYCGNVSGDVTGRDLHAWNFVKIYGQFYWVDVTWGDPTYLGGSSGKDNLNYDYLCVTDDDILKNRTITYPTSGAFTYPKCTDNSLNYYVKKGCYFESYDKSQVYNYILTEIGFSHTKKVDLKFASEKAFNEAVTDIFESDEYLNSLGKDLEKRFGVSISNMSGTSSGSSCHIVLEFV